MKEGAKPRSGAQAVHRAASILHVFTAHNLELGVGEISRALGLHTATTHRLLRCLLQEGLVAQDETTGKYRLGPELIPLAELARRSNPLPNVAAPHAHELAQTWGEAVNVDVFDHEMRMISVVQVPSLHLLQVSSSYMNPQPAHATSTGKVMLAFAHPSVVQAILSKGLPARTGKTITRPEAFLEELDAIRERSYATNIGELEEGMCAIGAPIRDGKGQVIAAISLGGPVVRVSAERIPEIAQAVIETGNRISQDLGWKPSVARGALSGLGI